MLRILPMLAAVAAVGTVLQASAAPASASAAVRTGSVVINPNSSQESFTQSPLQPTITVTVSYDSAGTITITQSGSVLSLFAPDDGAPYPHASWQPLGDITLSHCLYTPGADVPIITVKEWGNPMQSYNLDGTDGSTNSFYLFDPDISGQLLGTSSASPDGSTFTEVWSSPLLAGQNYTCVSLGGDNSLGELPGGYPGTMLAPQTFYFTGYSPVAPSPTPTPKPKPTAKPKPTPKVTTHRPSAAQLHALALAMARAGFPTSAWKLGHAAVSANPSGYAIATPIARNPADQGNGEVIFVDTHGRWRVLTQGSSFSGHTPGIPKQVLKALLNVPNEGSVPAAS